MSNQGRSKSGTWLNHVRLGYNYRLPELSAVLGLIQTERLPEILAKRLVVADMYEEFLDNYDSVQVPYVAPDVNMSWFVYVIKLCDDLSDRRDEILEGLRKQGVQCRDYFSPIHLQPYMVEKFGYKEGDFPVTENVAQQTIALPFFNNLKREQVKYVCDMLRKVIDGLK